MANENNRIVADENESEPEQDSGAEEIRQNIMRLNPSFDQMSPWIRHRMDRSEIGWMDPTTRIIFSKNRR